jgi:hypothetical protein
MLQGNSPSQREDYTMRAYYNITFEEMDSFLRHRGFTPITLPNVKEGVYSHVIDKNVCVRVYTGIVNGSSRKSGDDAIRVTVVKRLYTGKIIPISGRVSRVYRLENWRQSLTTRIDNTIDMYYAMADNKKKTAI